MAQILPSLGKQICLNLFSAIQATTKLATACNGAKISSAMINLS